MGEQGRGATRNIHGTRQVLFNLGTFGILSRGSSWLWGTSLSIVQSSAAPLVSTRSWWHCLSHFTVTTKRLRRSRCPLGAESALVEKAYLRHSTLVISHNSYHTQVSLPPSLETRDRAGTRHWVYLTPRSGLYAPQLPLEWLGSLYQIPNRG